MPKIHNGKVGISNTSLLKPILATLLHTLFPNKEKKSAFFILFSPPKNQKHIKQKCILVPNSNLVILSLRTNFFLNNHLWFCFPMSSSSKTAHARKKVSGNLHHPEFALAKLPFEYLQVYVKKQHNSRSNLGFRGA